MYAINSCDLGPFSLEDVVLTYYLPKGKVRKVKNLLASEQEEQEQESEPVQADEILSHWHHVCGHATSGV